MKKLGILVICGAMILSAGRAFAQSYGMHSSYGQSLTYGVKGGINITNVTGDDVENDNTDSKIGVCLGGYADIGINNQFSIQPELLYSQKGYSDPDSDSYIAFDYIEVPMLAKVSVDSLFFNAGPSLGFNASAKMVDDDGNDNDLNDVRSLDLGLAVGAGYDTGIMTIEARYTMGLSNIYDWSDYEYFDDPDMKNSAITILAGYSF
ncbi:MAG: porin family protein [Elusimicrobiota bacterium]